ncbi:DotI/IcmL/TraM family protein [Burkholderia orbicola]|jgi:intracellular multiplication protein IcmL|uniref:DotI/IcmL/TraM family protein n=1 Tax=Burkholderia orbicola TaxID=2978683 RepID=A0ABT8P1Y9_9BURK|nr:DotI/IcmL/TraM family protein [Burkholderia orbicola]MDN7527693.1 DotI/IcmL/TraM family protein [Burkholderia orbicola]
MTALNEANQERAVAAGPLPPRDQTESNAASPNAANEQLAELAAELHQTADAIEPAVRMEKDRKHLQFIAGSAVKLNFILATALLVSVVANGVLGWRAFNPDRQYFASDNGRIFPLIPMSQPYRKAADVIQYAKDTMNRSFTMDFLNWRQQLEDVRGNYTRDGFKSFIASLQASGVLATVRDRRMNMSVTAGTGVLTKEGVENGVYVWYVEMPIEVKLSGQTSELPAQRFLATVRIERVSTLDSIEGIGVGQLVTKPL